MNTIDETFLGIAEQEKRKAFRLPTQTRKVGDGQGSAGASNRIKKSRYGTIQQNKREYLLSPAEDTDNRLSHWPVKHPVPLKTNFVPKNASIMRINQDKFGLSEKERRNHPTTNTMLITGSFKDSAIKSGASNVNEPLEQSHALAKDT